ncbi:hypothetical protein R3P38DRAFT_3175006 [Favolaschia claudopus]|uniref:Bacteriophage T5 Orf172 DNA-binding domain-containing protein n=1 Tax=Favolaschia claudopus TaxID=2862362 RepID=A0AAW0DBT2_9AGAR
MDSLSSAEGEWIHHLHSFNTQCVEELDAMIPDQSSRYRMTYFRRDFKAAFHAPPSASDAPGVVYWLRKTNPNGSVQWKAGRTNDMGRRLREWRRQCRRCRIKIVHETPTRFAKKLERALHRFLKTADVWKQPCACQSCRVKHREEFEVERIGGVEKAIKVTRLIGKIVDSK